MQEYKHLLNKEFTQEDIEQIFHKQFPLKQDSNQSVCGHLFKKGEGVYRCKECGLDDTCVLCSKCFHASQHEGHNVSFYISVGSGGCCDCGDREAWKNLPNCAIHSIEHSNTNQLDQEMYRKLLNMLEFIVITLGASYFELGEPLDIVKVDAITKLENENEENFVLLLWNDESHSFPEVIDKLVQDVNCSKLKAREIAESVDKKGRDSIFISDNISNLTQIAMSLRTIRLGATIKQVSDYLKEMIALCLLKCMQKASQESVAFKLALSEAFISAPFTGNEFNELYSKREFVKQETLHHFNQCSTNLDLLFFYDLRLWKEMRNVLKSVYISSLVTLPEYKRKLGISFAKGYDKIAEGFLNNDREPDLNIIFFSVQIFTTPSIAKLAVNEYELLDNLLLILKQKFTLFNQEWMQLNLNLDITDYMKSIKYYPKQDENKIVCDSPAFRNRRYFHLFHDLKYLLQTDCIKQDAIQFAHVQKYIELVAQFSGLDPVKRAEMFHVEWEGESWIHAFNFSFILAQNVKYFANAIENNEQLSLFALKYAIAFATKILLDDSNPEFPLNFIVANSQVSFHHPLHWFISNLINPERLKKLQLNHPKFLISLLEFPLRTRVLVAQVRANMWVRNGFSIRHQAHNYNSIAVRDEVSSLDFYLIQISALQLSPKLFLETLLCRYELNAFIGSAITKPNYDESHIACLMEDFFLLLIHLLKSDLNPIPLEKEIRCEIIHSLAGGPSTHSELTRLIPDRLVESPLFDEILTKVATFRFPEGLTDNGKYELKEEMFSEFDFFHINLLRTQREAINENFRASSRKLDFTKISILKNSPFSDLIGCKTELGQYIHRAIVWNYKKNPMDGERKVKSDILLETILHLFMLLQSNEIGSFQENEVSVVDLLVQLYMDSDLPAEVHERIDVIISRFDVNDFPCIQQALDLKMQNVDKLEQEKKLKRRKEALERQAKVLASFTNQQAKFAESHAGLYDEINVDEELMEDENSNQNTDPVAHVMKKFEIEKETSNCIFCQETFSSESGYGVIGFIQRSRFETKWTVESSHLSIAQIKNSIFPLDSMNRQNSNGSVQSQKSLTCGLESQRLPLAGVYVSTCGHMIHFKCYETFSRTIQHRHFTQHGRSFAEDLSRFEFLCPLCNSLSNFVLPVGNGLDINEDVPMGEPLFPDNIVPIHSFSEWSEKLSDKIDLLVEPSSKPFEPILQIGSASFDSRKYMTFLRAISIIDVDERLYPISDEYNYDRFDLYSMSLEKVWLKGEVSGEIVENEKYETLVKLVNDSLIARHHGRFLSTWSNQTLPEIDDDSAAWRFLAYTIGCIESASRSVSLLGIHDMNVVLESIVPPQIQNTLRILFDCVCELNLIQAEKYKNIPSKAAKLVHYIVAKSPRFLQPVLLDDPFYVACAYASEPSISESSLCGDLHRSHVILRLFSREISRITIELFGPGRDWWKSLRDLDSSASSELSVNHPEFERLPEQLLNIYESVAKKSLSFVHDMSELVQHPLLALMIKTLHGVYSGVVESLDQEKDRNYIKLTNATLVNIVGCLACSENKYCDVSFSNSVDLGVLEASIETFLYPFLRRNVILQSICVGYVPNVFDPEASSDFEFYLKWLGLENSLKSNLSVDGLFELNHCIAYGKYLAFHLSGRLKMLHNHFESIVSSLKPATLPLYSYYFPLPPLNLVSPTISGLFELPLNIEQLLENCVDTHCKKCRSVPEEPCICLICGTIVCMGSHCCMENEKGECNLHLRTCGGEVGVYLIIKRCTIMLLHNENGCVMSAPYLDAHGETDTGLKRGKPLYLNSKRYAELGRLWMKHSIPSVVARKIEQSGGTNEFWSRF